MAVCSNACIALREVLSRKQVDEPLGGGEGQCSQTAFKILVLTGPSLVSRCL